MSIKKNTLINLVGAIIPMAVMLITIPLYLKVIGDERYGALALLWLMLGYFSFLEMGLGKATANQIAKARQASIQERSEIFWTALLVNLLIGVLGASVLWLLGDYLINGVLKMTEDFRQEAIKALPWMAVTLPLGLVSSVLNGALEGRNKFFMVNLLQISASTVFQIVPLMVAYLYGPSLGLIIPAAVISRALMNLPFLIACHRTVPFTLKPFFSLDRARLLFSYGGWVGLAGIINPIMSTADRLLIDMMLGAKAMAYYTIAYQLATRVVVLPASLARALFPRFSSDSTLSMDLAVESTSVLISFMTVIVVIGLIFLHPFLNLWVGPKVAEQVSPIAQIILVGVWANSLAYVPYNYLQGTGKPNVITKILFVELIPFLLILYYATIMWGLAGAATAWTIRSIGDSLILFLTSGITKKIWKMVPIPLIMVAVAFVLAFFIKAPFVIFVGSLILLITVAVWFVRRPIIKLKTIKWQFRLSNSNKFD